MAHFLGGWCACCAALGFNGALLTALGFEGWEKRCDRCGRTPEEGLADAEAIHALLAAEKAKKPESEFSPSSVPDP